MPLSFKRRIGEVVTVDNWSVKVMAINFETRTVRLEFTAPDEVKVLRGENVGKSPAISRTTSTALSRTMMTDVNKHNNQR